MAERTSSTHSLVVEGLSKAYGGTWALKDVSLRLDAGSVLAVVGHNGAGKSTMLRSLSGAERPDRGTISVDGVVQDFGRPADATAAGIACVYQELSLVDQLTVAENLFLGQEHTHGGRLDRREMNEIARDLCRDFGIRAAPTDILSSLSVAQRQMVEVARAVNRGSRYLLLDEPTTALERDQIDQLLKLITHLATAQRLGIMLVDHKLDEVYAVADRIVALSNGRRILEGSAAEVDRQKVIAAVVGNDAIESHLLEEGTTRIAPAAEAFEADPVLVVDHLRGPRLTDISLSVHAGEVLGVFGLVGAGRSRFLRTLYGLEPVHAGTLTLGGEPYLPRRPSTAIRAGVALVTEERKFDGYIPQLNARVNAVLPVLERFRTAGVLKWRQLHESAEEALSRVSIRGDTRLPISGLSGGNQQKVLFARATLQAPSLLLLDEPTKGVDIGAKEEIYSIIEDLAKRKGVAVIVVSSEEEEILRVADRVTVFQNGTCDGTSYNRGELTISDLRQLSWAGTQPA